MKYILLMSFAWFSLFSFAQIKTAKFEGRTVKVFPYRISDNSHYIDNVPYCPQVLEDGEYLIYFKPLFKIKTKKDLKRFYKGDTLQVAANFFIVNNKKEGAAKFYRRYGKKLLVTGTYKNDFKTGEWKMKDGKEVKIENYKEGKLDGYYYENDNIARRKKSEIKITAYYKEGKLHGTKTSFSGSYYGEKETIISEYKEGLLHGKYEKYNSKGKLVELKTYRNDELYGMVYSYPTAGHLGPISNDNLLVKSFKLNEQTDSFAEFYRNGKLIGKVINSDKPMPGFNVNDTNWWFNYERFDYNGIFKEYIYGYSEVYRVNSKNQKYNHYYLRDGQVQLPFTQINENGDTLINVERLEMTPDYYRYKITEYQYKGNKLSSKSQQIERNGYDLNSEISYKINYYKDSTECIFELYNPVEGYGKVIIKRDSTLIVYRNGKPTKTRQRYFIKGIGDTESISFGNDNNSNTEYVAKLIDRNTVQIIQNASLVSGLNIKYVRKVCIENDKVSSPGSFNLINPFLIFESSIISFDGKCGYILEYKGKPFTGNLICMEKERKKYKYGEKNYELQDDSHSSNSLYLIHKIHKMRPLLFLWDVDEYTDGRPYICEYNFKNGVLHGEQSAKSKDNFEIYRLNFKNGEPHGEQEFPRDYRNSRVHKGQYYYEDGKLEGYLTLETIGGKTELVAKYNKGKLDGNYVTFQPADQYSSISRSLTKLETSFKNDSIISDVIIYNNGKILEQIPFRKGKATGEYLKYNQKLINGNSSDSLHDYESYILHYLELKAKLDNGAYTDSIFGYFDNGNLKFLAVADDTFHHQYIIDSIMGIPCVIKHNYNIEKKPRNKYHEYIEPEYLYKLSFSENTKYNSWSKTDLDPMGDNTPAFYTFYYKNGRPSQQGHLCGNTKDGIWKYWSENGALMKIIDHKNIIQVIDSVNDISRLIFGGFITGYYPGGQKMMEGYITGVINSYQCDQEMYVDYEEVQYTNFYDEKGKSLLINGSGSVIDFHLNGAKYFSGQISNNRRTGLWKFYDPKGNLKEIGEYVDGQKHGRWLSGDLGGINYIDNACSVNEALEMIKLKEVRDIDISETIFEMGVELSRSHLILEKY